MIAKDFRLRLYRTRFVIELVGLVALIIYTLINYGLYKTTSAQLIEVRREFTTSQRASVDLGLSDGTFMYFTGDGQRNEIAICFRNNGKVTATNVVVEVRIAIAPPAAQIEMPPVGWKPDLINGFFVRSGETMSNEGLVGPDLGADTPYIFLAPISADDYAKLKDGKHGGHVVGRVSYQDGFGKLGCESFCANIPEADNEHFSVCATPISFCDGREHKMTFGRTLVGQKWTNVIPGQTAIPSPTWTPPPHDAAHTQQ